MTGAHQTETQPPTRADELRGAGDALAGALDHGTALAHSTHRAVADRTFGALGPAGAPVRAVHDRITGAAYRLVREGLSGASRRGAAALAERADQERRPLTAGANGSRAAAIVGGLWGDHLATRENPLALAMQIRAGGTVIAPERAALAGAFPAATPRVAVLIHGLMESDEAWLGIRGRRGGRPRTPFAPQLAQLGITPVTLRYNTGLTVEQNGARLAALLEQLLGQWPAGLGEYTLIGHSMGGLVARSAVHQALAGGHRWPAATGDVVYLGTPHLGADLERGAHLLGRALLAFPESRAFGDTIGARSAGIRDLHDGFDATVLPLADGIEHHAIVATLSDGLAGRLLGDLLVRAPSASGLTTRRTVSFAAGSVTRVSGINHFDLLDHPAVFARLSEVLTSGRGSRAGQ